MDKWIEVAKSLCADLDNDINDVANRLKEWGNEHNFTPEEVDKLCTIDSVYMFDQIY